MANNAINLVDLDFASIKASLKNYLRGNELFKDYDFEASNMNLLLDILAQNGYRTAFYQNMVLNESFLDSAVLRNSVISRAKELNYLPSSVKSSRARVHVTFNADGTSAPYIIPKGSNFTALVKNDSYTFSLDETLTVASANNSYEFEADVYEGQYVTDSYNISGIVGQVFTLTNPGIDTDSITVTVFEGSNELGDVYNYATSLLDLGPSDKVFFLQAGEGGTYQVLLGDNNLGFLPPAGSVIRVEYRVASGEVSNGAREFTINFDPTNADELTSDVVVNTLENAKEGSEAETLESIKYMAPRHFQVQERAVTASDYEVILKAAFPEINAIHAFGGEDLTPARYGKVFISVDLNDVDGLPDSKKTEYKNFLKNRTTFGIVPEFAAPEYTFIRIDSKIRYNVNLTSASRETLKTIVQDVITQYNEDNLDDFNVILRQSRLEALIDDADPSIISSITDMQIFKKINPVLAEFQSFNIDFGVALRTDLLFDKSDSHGADTISAVESSNFFFKSELCRLDDDGQGNLRIMRIVGNRHEFVSDIGTVDYTNGIISIRDLKVDNYVGSSIRIFVRPEDPDVSVRLNNILTIDSDEVVLTIEEVRE